MFLPFNTVLMVFLTFGVPAAVIVILAILRHKQQMELIRHGFNPAGEFPACPGKKSLFWGILFLGFGLALLVSNFWDFDEDLMLSGFLFMGVGIALLVYWKLTAPDRERAMRLYEERFSASYRNSIKTNIVSESSNDEETDCSDTAR